MNKDKKQKIIVILGPTASGKSNLAVKLAKKFNGEVISADSRQVYRGLDIGSGKVPGEWKNNCSSRLHLSRHSAPLHSSSRNDLFPQSSNLNTKRYTLNPVFFVYKKIVHHCLDIVSPKKVYSAGEFKERAGKAIEDILSRRKVPIICGGTGFYIQSVVNNLILPKVKPDPKLRKKLNKKTANELFKMLKKLDPKRAKDIDPKNPHRLIRAIEIAKTLGKVPHLDVGRLSKYEFLQIGVKWPDEVLKKRIRKRLLARLEQGMIAEVKKLHKQGVTWKRLYELGLEYRYVSLFLRKELTREEMIKKLNMEIWHFAKRQITWFKRDKRIKWIKKYSDAEKLAKKFIEKR